MIPPELVLVQLSQFDGYISAVELAMTIGTSAVELRQVLCNLGDLVECNDNDEWRVTHNIAPERILSVDERAERDLLEQTVEQSFVSLGNALKTLRDKRLYRETHASFKEYVRDRFGYSRRAADYLIGAAEVVENLKREQFVLGTNVLPTKQSQCRLLMGHPVEIQCKAWNRAVELMNTAVGSSEETSPPLVLKNPKIPPARIIKQAVEEIVRSEDKKQEQNLSSEIKNSVEPSFREVNYKAGTGIEYTVKLDEETFYRLKRYQDKIGSATKCGAIARLLDGVE